jgi:acyl-CoA thioesterase
MTADLHPLDLATRLEPLAEGRYRGRITPAYANMVGPFGGAIAAVVLNAVLLHPRRLGEPVALTVNFAGPIADADFEVQARPLRTNRSTQHWLVELLQNGETAISATLMSAERRPTWSDQELACPAVPPAAEVAVTPTGGFTPWVGNYEMRFIDGLLTFNPAHAGDSSQSRLWVRDQPPRVLDFLSLTALADVFFPRIFLRKQQPCPAGTVSMTLYFHAGSAELAACGAAPLLACARAQVLHDGFADQTAELWSADGRLLATSAQLVYYKA